MEDEYLAPTELSFSTPFKRAFPAGVGNGNDSYNADNELQHDQTLDFLENFQNLALSAKKNNVVKPKRDTVAQSILNSTVSMGVNESKENSLAEEAPSFLNFGGDAPRTPNNQFIQRRLLRKSEAIGPVSEPVPKTPKAHSAPNSPGEDVTEPLMMGMKTPDPNLKRLQDELMKQEMEFEEELMKQDEIIREKEEQLEGIYHKIDAISGQKEKGKLKKYEQKIASLTSEIENLQSVLVRAEAANVEVINEREQLYSDLRGVEMSYNDLMGKYNRCKESVSQHASVEMGLRNRDEELMTKIDKKGQNYEALKSQVQEGVETLYREYDDKLHEKHQENETLKVRLMRLEMRVGTLENDLEQKTQENSQLHKLCDDIISGRVSQ